MNTSLLAYLRANTPRVSSGGSAGGGVADVEIGFDVGLLMLVFFFFECCQSERKQNFADDNKIHQNYYKIRHFTQNMKFHLKNIKINGRRTFRRPSEDSVWTGRTIYR